MALKSIQKTLCLMKKIGGTIHLAVGSSYPETGSKNKSNLH
jgi:leucyl aminopeptidase (aminopeptidase T)